MLSPSQAQVKESLFLPIKQSTQGGERAPDKHSVSSLVAQAVHGLVAEFFSPKERRRGSSLPLRLEMTNFTTEEGFGEVVSRAFGLRKRGVSSGLGFSSTVLERKILRGGRETKALPIRIWQRKTLRGGKETKVLLLLFWQKKTLRG